MHICTVHIFMVTIQKLALTGLNGGTGWYSA